MESHVEPLPLYESVNQDNIISPETEPILSSAIPSNPSCQDNLNPNSHSHPIEPPPGYSPIDDTFNKPS